MIEVQTPVLSMEAVIDRHIDLLSLDINSQADSAIVQTRRYYLQSSPEACMKRLLAGGADRIYQVGPVFRAGERGERHNVEFTMVEWYRCEDDYRSGMQFTSDLLSSLLDTPSCEAITFEEAFKKATGISCLDSRIEQLAAVAVEKRLVDHPSWSSDWDDWVHLMFSFLVQPTLGLSAPCLVTHFPSSQAALAKISELDPRTAERFELFYRGIELANGYHELTDANELRRRNQIANVERIRDGKEPLPIESQLLQAMEYGLPNSTGCALGFDRVVMLAAQAKRIDEVIPFPIERA
jgi:elongation factor P--(R)-beta-lysine ligase